MQGPVEFGPGIIYRYFDIELWLRGPVCLDRTGPLRHSPESRVNITRNFSLRWLRTTINISL